MKTLLVLISYLFSLALLASPTRRSDDDLTEALAQQRKAQVSSVSYDVTLEIEKNKDGYSGAVVMDLALKDLSKDLSIDSMVQKITHVLVNGKEIKVVQRKGSFDIPKKFLAQKTQIKIEFSNLYSKESAGFQRVIDPEDKAEYLYTDFEPYNAHKFVPCLDQPDLKAKFKLTVTAPQEWKVIGNELIESSQQLSTATTKTVFSETPPLSTYLFFFGAGPFVLWEDTFEGLPLHLYARKSVAKDVDAENIHATTKKGLKFFNDYFGLKYPFSKYGQVFIPEFAWGGMENPGAVTLNERNIFRGPVTINKKADRDDLILHEMAHMWFGDLVTMEWWNDLWLNESFATYLASLAQDRAMKQKLTWMDFFTTKAWGYWQDKLITTHPIETPVPDVRTARGNFDGITYAKGASALKQLHFYVGEEGFREGLRYYFNHFAWKNTQRKDFIDAIALKSKVNLDEWTKQWLKTAGPNEVEINFECAKEKITKAQLVQKPSVSRSLSPHRMKFGLYELEDKNLELEKIISVSYSQETTELKEMLGEDCPDFVMPNEDDQDYGLFSLDHKSLSNVKLALTKLDSPLNRLMLWNLLSEMMRDQKLAATQYFDIVAYGLENETDEGVLGFVLGRHGVVKDQYQLYLTKNQREELAPRLEGLVWKRMESAPIGSSLQMSFFDFYVTIAQTKESSETLFKMLTKKLPPKGIVLDQDRRWAILQNLGVNGHAQALTLSSAELKLDPSTQGKKMDLTVRSAFPDLASKKKMWKDFYLQKDLTYSSFKEAASKVHLSNHPELSEPFVDEFFRTITKTDWATKDDVLDIYFEQLFPMKLCSQKIVEQSAKQMKAAKKLTALARRAWMEAHDELQRCVKVRTTVSSQNY